MEIKWKNCMLYIIFLADAEALGTGMQLHLIDSDDEFGPYLIQVLWGRLISAVIYRRTEVRNLVIFLKSVTN